MDEMRRKNESNRIFANVLRSSEHEVRMVSDFSRKTDAIGKWYHAFSLKLIATNNCRCMKRDTFETIRFETINGIEWKMSRTQNGILHLLPSCHLVQTYAPHSRRFTKVFSFDRTKLLAFVISFVFFYSVDYCSCYHSRSLHAKMGNVVQRSHD